LEAKNIKEAQNIMLRILIEFDRICVKYGLTYWLDFGTLLGAVRHRGFIPWDDDLDVSMPYGDYRHFLKIAAKELKEDFFLQTKQSDPHYINYFAKIRDRHSTFVDVWETGKDIRYHQGIYIDIFPAMRISEKTLNSPFFRSLILLSKATHNRKVRLDFITKYFIRWINAYSENDGDYLISAAETMHYLKPVAAKRVLPVQYLNFEDRRFPVPNDWDSYLRRFFGDDYMLMPPENKRYWHNSEYNIERPCRWEVDHKC
jgi:lipopolysaccharide cholinephosphotransferase